MKGEALCCSDGRTVRSDKGDPRADGRGSLSPSHVHKQLLGPGDLHGDGFSSGYDPWGTTPPLTGPGPSRDKSSRVRGRKPGASRLLFHWGQVPPSAAAWLQQAPQVHGEVGSPCRFAQRGSFSIDKSGAQKSGFPTFKQHLLGKLG